MGVIGIDLFSFSIGDELLLLCGLRGDNEFPRESIATFLPVLDAPLGAHKLDKSNLDPESLASLSRRHFSLSI